MATRVTDELGEPDAVFETSLRPVAFEEFGGQDKVRERLELAVTAATQREEPIDHVLLSGPPGLGKTTLAHIIAKAMGANLRCTSGPTIEKAADLAGLLTNLEEGDVLFIDEIHRMQKTVEEYLYPAMEDYQLDIIIDQGPNARSVRLNLPRFTLIGATTRSYPAKKSFILIFINGDVDGFIFTIALFAGKFFRLCFCINNLNFIDQLLGKVTCSNGRIIAKERFTINQNIINRFPIDAYLTIGIYLCSR